MRWLNPFYVWGRIMGLIWESFELSFEDTQKMKIEWEERRKKRALKNGGAK